MVFRIGDETKEYVIPTQILDIERPFNAVNLRASDGSIGVGYVDNMALAENPVPLAGSDSLLVVSDGAPLSGGDLPVSPDDVPVSVDDVPAEGISSSGGCSIAGSGTGHGTLIGLILFALAGLLRRKKLYRRKSVA